MKDKKQKLMKKGLSVCPLLCLGSIIGYPITVIV